MANWLKMDKHNAALGLARQGWSFRRIGAELGIDRGTVARHVRAAAAQQAAVNAAISIAGSDPPDSQGAGPPGALPDGVPQPLTPAGTGPPHPNAAISIPGSAGRRNRCEPLRELIQTKLELGLTAQRIRQDLKTEHGFDGSYQSGGRNGGARS